MVVSTSREVLEGGRSSFVPGVVLGEVVCDDQVSSSNLLAACGLGHGATL